MKVRQVLQHLGFTALRFRDKSRARRGGRAPGSGVVRQETRPVQARLHASSTRICSTPGKKKVNRKEGGEVERRGDRKKEGGRIVGPDQRYTDLLPQKKKDNGCHPDVPVKKVKKERGEPGPASKAKKTVPRDKEYSSS